jgi:hypothetical protein
MRHGAFRALQAASPLRSSDHRAVRATCELQVRSGDIRGVVKILITGRRWNLHGHRIPFCGAQAFVCGLMSDAVSGQTSTCRSRRKASGGPNTGRIDTPHEGMGENFHDEETHTAPTRSPTDHRRLAAPSSWWGGSREREALIRWYRFDIGVIHRGNPHRQKPPWEHYPEQPLVAGLVWLWHPQRLRPAAAALLRPRHRFG